MGAENILATKGKKRQMQLGEIRSLAQYILVKFVMIKLLQMDGWMDEWIDG